MDSPHVAALDHLTPVLRKLNDLKRVRAAHFAGSYADRLFVDAWRMLLAGGDATRVAMNVTARAVAATCLAAIDGEVLRSHGLTTDEIDRLLIAAIDKVDGLPTPLLPLLREAVSTRFDRVDEGDLPSFVGQLLRQPRAGATHPGKPRMILEPAESHGDHCLTVAVYAVLVSPRFGGDPGTVFLTGLAHHLFNGSLPDAGFDGDVVLHNAGVLGRVTDTAFALAKADLAGRSPRLRVAVEHSLGFTKQTQPPESQCFHAADVFDRVLEMAFFDRCAAFTLADAVVGLDIVHVAPEQAFQRRALAEAGIWKDWPRE